MLEVLRQHRTITRFVFALNLEPYGTSLVSSVTSRVPQLGPEVNFFMADIDIGQGVKARAAVFQVRGPLNSSAVGKRGRCWRPGASLCLFNFAFSTFQETA